MITPWGQTLQSLETITGVCHQEVQCHLHNPDIESRVIYIYIYVCVCVCVLCCGDLSDSGENEKDYMVFITELHVSFNQISLPFLFSLCVLCLVFFLQWSLWCEQIKVQMKILPSCIGVELVVWEISNSRLSSMFCLTVGFSVNFF